MCDFGLRSHSEGVSLERLQSTTKTNSGTPMKTTQVKLHFCHGATSGETQHRCILERGSSSDNGGDRKPFKRVGRPSAVTFIKLCNVSSGPWRAAFPCCGPLHPDTVRTTSTLRCRHSRSCFNYTCGLDPPRRPALSEAPGEEKEKGEPFTFQHGS